MLMQMNQIMGQVQSGCALAEPVIYSADSINWCFETASRKRSPVVIGCLGMGDFWEEAAELTEFFARKYSQVPSALSLENCREFHTAVKAFRLGFTNVIVDGIREEALLKSIAHMAHSMGGSVELSLELGDDLWEEPERLETLIRRTGIDGLYLTMKISACSPIDSNMVRRSISESQAEEAENRYIQALKKLEEGIHIPLILDGDIFCHMDFLSFTARTIAARIRFERALSAGAVRKAEELISQPETDRRGLTRLQTAVREGYEEKLGDYFQVLNTHNRW
ncbi:class II fructose-bisphosphate aldolase [Lachnospiraceae bacterium 62-35]